MNEQISETIDKLIQNNKELKSSIGKMNNILNRLGVTLRVDICKQVEEAYQKGLDDAWEAARKIVEMSDPPYWGVFNEYKNDLFKKITAAEAINKIKAYEEKQKVDDEIKVGDEVRQVCESGAETGLRCIVTAIDGDRMSGFSQDGKANICLSQVNRWWKKTGRHFDIDKILEEMRK